jgi:colanic acid biosynthesis glycosyl transferase WcaI
VRILVLNQFFYPDPAATSQFLTDLARGLAREGHSVTAICSASEYVHRRDAESAEKTIRIIRVRGAKFSRGPAGRVVSYLSFYCGALWRALWIRKQDVVLTLTTPPLLCLVGTVLKALRGSRHYIWEMDVYPDVAVALGVLRPKSAVTRLLRGIANFSRRRADGVIALGECMKERLGAGGIPAEKIHVAENWADGSKIGPLPHVEDGRLKILYSGNLGLAHDVDTITEAILRLAADPQFSFSFAGGGPQRGALEDACKQYRVANVTFEPYKDAADLCGHFGGCDVGLVTQKAATLGCVVASKTYALMAAARPILFIGPREATPARIIERFRCGWQVDPGDVDALVELLRLLAGKPELVREAGARSYAAFREHYDLPLGVANIAGILGCTAEALRAQRTSRAFPASAGGHGRWR